VISESIEKLRPYKRCHVRTIDGEILDRLVIAKYKNGDFATVSDAKWARKFWRGLATCVRRSPAEVTFSDAVDSVPDIPR